MIRSFICSLLMMTFVNSSVAESLDADSHENYPPALVDILQRVIEHHPFLTATKEEIQGARGELLGNQGAFDPVLKGELSGYPKGDYSGTYASVFAEQPLEWMGSKLFAGYRRGGGTFPVYENYNETNDDGEARVGIEVPILRDRPTDRRRTAIQRAAMQIAGADLTLSQRQIELVRSASIEFWEWAAAIKKYEAYRELLKVAEERDRQLVERVSAGDFSEFDRKDNLRQVYQRKSLLVAAERASKKAEYELSLFIWKSDGSPDDAGLGTKVISFSEPPKISSVEARIKEDKAIQSRPDIARISNQIEQQKVEKTLAENQILPRLDLRAYGSKDYGDGSQSRDETELKVGINIEIPLETRTQQGRLSVIAAKERELAQQKLLTLQKVKIEIANSRNALELALERIAIIRNELRLAQELEAGERTKLEQGDSNLIFLNLREQAATDAVVREVEAIADAWKAYAIYRAAVGER